MTYFLYVVNAYKANGGTVYRYPHYAKCYQSMLLEVTDGVSNPK
jgi:hypothetical protein